MLRLPAKPRLVLCRCLSKRSQTLSRLPPSLSLSLSSKPPLPLFRSLSTPASQPSEQKQPHIHSDSCEHVHSPGCNHSHTHSHPHTHSKPVRPTIPGASLFAKYSKDPSKFELPCWNCPAREIESPGICRSCGVLQPVAEGRGPFEVLGIPRSFDVDMAALEQNFKNLQKKLHPDKYTVKSQREQRYSLDHASEVNMAYQTLRDPLRRAQYLLKINGYNAGGDGTISDAEFLMEMMERREAIAEARNPEEILKLQKELKAELARCMASLTGAFNAKNFAEANQLTIRLNYLNSALNEIEKKLP